LQLKCFYVKLYSKALLSTSRFSSFVNCLFTLIWFVVYLNERNNNCTSFYETERGWVGGHDLNHRNTFLVSQAFRLNPVFLVLQKFKSHLLRVRFQFFLKILKISTDNEGRHPECTQPSKKPRIDGHLCSASPGEGGCCQKRSTQFSRPPNFKGKVSARVLLYVSCLSKHVLAKIWS
jgi:hypothetical protein